MKKCNSCKIEKELTNFYKDSSLICGYRGKCKSCVKLQEKTRQIKCIVLTERVCKECKNTKPITDYYVSKRSKNGYTTSCKVCYNVHVNSVKKNNPLKYKTKQSDYKRNNRKNINLYNRNKYANDINFKLSSSLRSRLRQALLCAKNNKLASTMSLLGCDIIYFRSWIEFQFEEWMNWENYGQWELDHVLPCSMFDLSKKSEQEKCFHWSNIRPLKKESNNSKSNILDDEIIKKHNYVKHLFIQQISLNALKEEEGSTTRQSNLNQIKII